VCARCRVRPRRRGCAGVWRRGSSSCDRAVRSLAAAGVPPLALAWRVVLPVKTMSVLRTDDDGAWRVMSLLGASSWDTSIPPLLVLATASPPPPSGLPWAICSIASAAVASPLCYTFWTRLIPVVCYCCGSVSVFHWAPLLRRRSSCWWCHQILCQVVIHLLDHSPTRVPPRVWRWMARHGAWMFSSKV